MYIPPNFRNEDKAELLNFIEQNSFGILVNQGENKILATHIPLYLYKNTLGEEVLHGHVARGNEAWKSFKDRQEVLAIFNGPHAYISSSWYDHENVPTWNYIAVHVYGQINIIEGEALYESLKILVDKYEKTVSNPIPIEKMTPEYLKRETNGIVGFEIKIKEIQGAYKLSQNRDNKNYDAIISELNKSEDKNSLDVAKEMTQRKGDCKSQLAQ